MKLTREKLLKSDYWNDWQNSEYTQLDQYDAQGMFGDPVPVADKGVVFNLVWTYNIKELDKRKKARSVPVKFACSIILTPAVWIKLALVFSML